MTGMHSPLKLRALVRLLLLLAALSLSACSLGYYGQAALGQMRISTSKQPVAGLLADPELAPDLRARLELSQKALAFAHDELELPDNGSYRSYVDTGQPAVVFNVFAAPEFGIDARTWCFPIAGCVAYRGYFSEAAARRYAARLQAAGDDVYVAGVAAYSTLGRLKDPLLNTMLPMSETAFVGLLFHELAHQRLYVPGDTAFNEGFASALETIGLQRWRVARGTASAPAQRSQREAAVRELLLAAREQLARLYADPLAAAQLRADKQRLLAELTADYQRLTAGWDSKPYQPLFAAGINNASLAAIAAYADYQPAFMALYADCDGVLACWYDAAAALADEPPPARQAKLADWLSRYDPAASSPAAGDDAASGTASE
ncbi:MAG: aminopeptidase [Gammaproteobacteria bacterium]|jgi:predicted aminopeptidase|nr:aminopeptidase [Gammaproteobacteria bacterium]